MLRFPLRIVAMGVEPVPMPLLAQLAPEFGQGLLLARDEQDVIEALAVIRHACPEDRHAALIAGEIASSEVLLGFATPWTLMACERGDSIASYDGPAPRSFSVRGPACYTPRRLVMVHPDMR